MSLKFTQLGFFVHSTQMSSYDIYNIVSQFSRVKTMRKLSRPHRNSSNDTLQRYVITLSSPRTPELKELCQRVAYNFSLTLNWTDDDIETRSNSLDSSHLSELAGYLARLPPKRNAPENILNALNDDCLRMVFAMSPLDVNDLYVLSKTCKQFRAIAIDVFKHNFKGDLRGFRCDSLSVMHEFFRIFGASFESLNLKELPDADTDILLRIIIQCCPNLKQLSYALHERQSARYLRPLLKQLTTITTFGDRTFFDALFDPNAQYVLHTWRLHCTNTMLPTIHFSQLVHLELDSCGTFEFHQNMLETFCRSNSQIRHLIIKKCRLNGGIGSLVQHLPNLKTLDIESNVYLERPDANLNAFGRLHRLKVLSIKRDIVCRDGTTMNRILQLLCDNDVHLEHLTLECVAKTPMLFRMKWLKSLRMDCLDDDELTRLSVELHQLESIEAINGWMSYNGIRNFVMQSRAIQKALFEIRIPIFHLQTMEIDQIGRIRQERELDLSVDFAVYTHQRDDILMLQVSLSEVLTLSGPFLRRRYFFGIFAIFLELSRFSCISCSIFFWNFYSNFFDLLRFLQFSNSFCFF